MTWYTRKQVSGRSVEAVGSRLCSVYESSTNPDARPAVGRAVPEVHDTGLRLAAAPCLASCVLAVIRDATLTAATITRRGSSSCSLPSLT
ncbi:hypothetical protein IscW_ISCW001137 [Ixodes scapularis]|uniref:Uncharacterized protein n=1 Tax=Ixodes scapularis TaxID=6945 RepID=B7P3B6_IXOSC|nr:hypothetical protein IscW_ISCW001137 [Ixodes scapularis]|eukprot:XP_002403868.1 hypothetical protein IscW_ISCW001137 [Ixodes scapularis]